jgi:hypothetical protein
MNKVRNKPLDIQILLGSILCFLYFTMQWALHYYKVETILAGVLTEMATIPFLLLLVALFAGIIWLLFIKKEGKPFLLYIALLFLAATAAMLFLI